MTDRESALSREELLEALAEARQHSEEIEQENERLIHLAWVDAGANPPALWRDRSAALAAALHEACADLLLIAARVGFAGLPAESDKIQAVEARVKAALAHGAPPAISAREQALVAALRSACDRLDAVQSFLGGIVGAADPEEDRVEERREAEDLSAFCDTEDLRKILAAPPAPIPMVLHCPRCSVQHIDQPQPEKGWDNPPHRSHECQACGYIWRPADIPTNGVATVSTKGKADMELPAAPPAISAPGHTDLMVTPESLDKYLEDNPPPAISAREGALEIAVQRVEHLSLVIEAAVRRFDLINYPGVLSAIHACRDALKGAAPPAGPDLRDAVIEAALRWKEEGCRDINSELYQALARLSGAPLDGKE